jgi:hypothetical protein
MDLGRIALCGVGGQRPGQRHASAAGAAEAVGGALAVAGAATCRRLAAGMVSGTMITAIRKCTPQTGSPSSWQRAPR